MKRYCVEEQMDGTYRVYFVNLVTEREVYLKDIFSSKKEAQIECAKLALSDQKLLDKILG